MLRAEPLTAPPWASGVEYSGPAALASSVAVAMTVPDDIPPATDLFYVALSVFDGAESYDQVGFANDNGSWGVYYSTSPVCSTRPATQWNALGIDRDVTYTFEISVEGGGLILFAAFLGTGAVVWQEAVYTGATDLLLESNQTCGTSVLPGWTESEQVYAATLGNPPYNFVLTNASEDGLPESDWVDLPGSNNSTRIDQNGSNTTLYNEPFTLHFTSASDAATLETAASPQVLQSTVAVSIETPGTTVDLSATTSSASWGFTAVPASGNVSFTSVVTIDLPAGIPSGTYVIEIEASNATEGSNRVAIVITALPGLTLSVSTLPASGEFDANETARFSPNATGGAPGYTYSWPTLPKGCAAESPQWASCQFPIPGVYSVVASVADTLGYILHRNVTVHAVPDPVLSTGAGPVRVGLGNQLSLAAALTGGLPPFIIAWKGLPAGCRSVNSTELSCTPTAAGEFGVTVLSTDHTGFRSSLTIPVTVENPPAASPFLQTTVGLLLIGGGLVLLIAACGVVLARRHRRP